MSLSGYNPRGWEHGEAGKNFAPLTPEDEEALGLNIPRAKIKFFNPYGKKADFKVGAMGLTTITKDEFHYNILRGKARNILREHDYLLGATPDDDKYWEVYRDLARRLRVHIIYTKWLVKQIIKGVRDRMAEETSEQAWPADKNFDRAYSTPSNTGSTLRPEAEQAGSSSAPRGPSSATSSRARPAQPPHTGPLPQAPPDYQQVEPSSTIFRQPFRPPSTATPPGANSGPPNFWATVMPPRTGPTFLPAAPEEDDRAERD